MKSYFPSRQIAYLFGIGAIVAFTGMPLQSFGQQTVVETEAQTPATPVALTEETHATAPAETASNGGFYEEYLQGKLQIGTRSVYRSLTNGDSGHRGGTYGSGTLLGTIYAVEEKQDYLPTHLFLNYFFSKYVGVELAWDSMHGKTVAVDTSTNLNKTDGDFALWGPTLSLIARLPNSTAFTPYIGLGFGYFKGSFNESDSWSQSLYSIGEINRVMVIDNTTATLATVGVTWDLDTNWKLDCSLQYVKADADATFDEYINGNKAFDQTGHFPMDNIAVRLGIVYAF